MFTTRCPISIILSEVLYGDGFSLKPLASTSEYMTLTASASDECTGEGKDHRGGLDEVREDDLLTETRWNIANNFFCLEDWARWKARGYSDEDSCAAVESRFEDGYIGWSSDGWAYFENDVDEDSDQELCELEVNWMGHLFIFGRSQFDVILQDAPPSSDELVAKLIQLSSQVPLAGEHSSYTKSAFQHLYLSCSAQAFSW